MSLVRLRDVTKEYDDNLVLREVYFRLQPGDWVGLIGRNGAGKTTLLKLILGQEKVTSGTIELDQDLQIGYFSQFSDLGGKGSITNELEALFAQIHKLEDELLEIEIAIEESETGTDLTPLLNRQASLLEEMERRGGWTYQNEIDTALTRLGFSQAHLRCSGAHPAAASPVERSGIDWPTSKSEPNPVLSTVSSPGSMPVYTWPTSCAG